MFTKKNKEFLLEYGFAIFPKGTTLFRIYKDNEIYSSMFFSFRPDDAGSETARNGNVQIWRTKKEIIAITLVKKIEIGGSWRTNINDLYKRLFPKVDTSNFTQLTIKNHNINLHCKPFTNKLSRLGINAWVNSIEDLYPLELFIWHKYIHKLVENIGTTHKWDKLCSLPSVKFYFAKATIENLINSRIEWGGVIGNDSIVEQVDSTGLVREKGELTIRHVLKI